MSLKIKAEYQTLFRLVIDNTESFESELEKQIKQAPDLMRFASIILDPPPEANLEQLVGICELYNLKTNLIITSDEKQIKQAENLKIRVASSLSGTKPQKNNSVPGEIKSQPLSYKIISKPVRSGQQIYAKNAHLVILKSVGAGAEVMADGDIHIYNELRGRAMAGTNGRTESRIICQTMNAELIAIAGNYIVREDMPEMEGATQAILEQDKIKFQKL